MPAVCLLVGDHATDGLVLGGAVLRGADLASIELCALGLQRVGTQQTAYLVRPQMIQCSAEWCDDRLWRSRAELA
jgi:hypothetical protein